jgi:predicted PurR-regulated permease PerM
MTQNHRELVSIFLTVTIVLCSLLIIHRFIAPMLWAAVIVIATFPVYQKFEKSFGRHRNIAAFLFTMGLSCLIILPISWLITLLVKECHLFATYLVHLNMHGDVAPAWMNDLPWLKKEFLLFWEENIGKPGGLKDFLMNWDKAITPASYYVQQIGVSLAHRSIQLFFALLSLFFFYRDGKALSLQIDVVGEYCLAHRWRRFSKHLPQALRSIVNGTITIGIGVGVLLGIGYWVLDFPAPVLMGFITAMVAMIPFAGPFILLIGVLVFFSEGAFISGIILLIWGAIVMFLADHVIKPLFIGGAVQLPFLVVLFGILGGVETLGLLGLFIGPVIMVLFVTLWQEAQS